MSAVGSRRYVDANGVITYIDHGDLLLILGNTTESVDKRSAKRASRWALLETAKLLLPDYKVARCMTCGAGGVVVRHSPSANVASYGGIRTCGTVWHCPVCTAKISNSRRGELNKLLLFGRKMGYSPCLLTLTISHGVNDLLSTTLSTLKKAKRMMHQSRAWREIAPRLVGFVTATEITYGANGWHPHFHMLFLVAARDYEAVNLLNHLCDPWLAAVAKNGFYATPDYGFDVQDAASAGDYISKWGAGEEMTLSGVKSGRSDRGRSPWALLRDAHDDLKVGFPQSEAGELFVEYAKVFAGRHQLVWSNGLKRLLGVVERSDGDLAAEPELEDMVDIAEISKPLWLLICRRMLQAELLTVAEQGAESALDYIDAWLQALQLQEELNNAPES